VVFREQKQIVVSVVDSSEDNLKQSSGKPRKRKRSEDASSSESSESSENSDHEVNGEDSDKTGVEDEDEDSETESDLESEEEADEDGEDEDTDEDTDEDESSSSTSSISTSSSSDTDSNSDSNSDSDSSTDSSSNEDSPRPEKQQKPTIKPIPNKSIRPPVIPGQGSQRTHLRNQRKVRVKRLKRLIEEGTLPGGSTLIDLDNYEGVSHYRPTPKFPPPTSIPASTNKEVSPTNPKDAEEGLLAPARKVDVAAVTRFIKAGLSGNEGYDRAREEARAKGKSKMLQGTESIEDPAIAAFVPRNVKAKRQKTAHVDVPSSGVDIEMSVPSPSKEDDVQTASMVPEQEDPLVAGFYKQVELATKFRRSTKTHANIVNISPTPAKKSKSDGTVPATVVVRAFECEPEWCGYVEAEEGEEVDSVEIDPPKLPFVDNYRRKQKQDKTPVKPAPAKPTPTNSTPTSSSSPISLIPIEEITPFADWEILLLPKLAEPSVGKDIYFRSMFLHPTQSMPVIQWRWGRITDVYGNEVRIDIQGPKFTQDDDVEEMEEGEIEDSAEVLLWSQLYDVRYH
jgi:hypothetical protein